jgi:hypothetical protein
MDFVEELRNVATGKTYIEYGLQGNPFSVNQEDILTGFVGREKELRQIARAINNLKENNLPHIAILGSHGIGKTHFLRYVYESMRPALRELGFSDAILISGYSDFSDQFCQGQLLTDLLKRKNNGEKILIFIDDIDVIINRKPELCVDIMNTFEGGIIGTWNPRDWDNAKRDPKIRAPKTEVIYLDRLNQKDCEQILINRISSKATSDEGKNLFSGDIITTLAQLSDGNPYRLLTYARRLLYFIMDNGLKTCDKLAFNNFCQEVGFISIERVKEEIDTLSARQLDTLRVVIEKREVTAPEVGEFLGITRVGALQHLQALVNKRILEMKPKQNYVYYYVPSELEYDVADYLEKKKVEVTPM